MLRVTPLYGAESHHPDSKLVGALPPNSTVVEYAGVRLLVNVGSGSNQELDQLSKLTQVDAILICDATMESLGGLPKAFPPTSKSSIPPIYATYPTLQLGPMTLYDHHANISLDGGNPGFSLDDVDALFAPSGNTALSEERSSNKTSNETEEDVAGIAESGQDSSNSKATNTNKAYINTLKYSQSILLTPKRTKQQKESQTPTLSITPHRSGHVIGGAYWVLQRLSDETTIVVCPGGAYNPSRELHLDSSTMALHARAPDAMIIRPGGMGGGTLGSLYRGSPPALQPQPWRTVQSTLLDQIMSVLRRNGNVLLPTDAAGRVLELLLLLDGYWKKQRLSSTYHLVWVGPMTHNVLAYVQSQLEWMNSSLGKQFDSGGKGSGNPFALGCVHVCTTTQQVEELERDGLPMVVLASGGGGGVNGCDCGPARDWLVRWGEGQDNAIFFTNAQMCTLRSTSGGGSSSNLSSAGDKKKTTKSIDSSKSHPRDTSGSQRNVMDLENPRGAPRTVSSTTEPTAAVEGADTLLGSNLPAAINPSTQSAAAQLLYAWCQAKAQHREMADEIAIDVLVPARRRLEGEELALFTHQEEEARRKRVAEEERIELLKEVELARGRLRLGEEDLAKQQKQQKQEEEDDDGDVNMASTQNTLSITPAQRRRQSSQASKSRNSKRKKFDSNLFLKYSKPIFMTFADQEEAVGIGQDPLIAKFGIGESIGSSNAVLMDDYGIAVKVDKFHDLVTGSDASKYSQQAGGTGRLVDDALFNRKAAGSQLEEEHAEPMDEISMEIADLSEGKGIIRGRNGRPPTKVYTIARQLEVLAEVSYVSLEGRVSARAGRQTVRALQPRQLVILGGASPAPHLVASNSESLATDASLAVVTDDESNLPKDTYSRKNVDLGEAQLLADAVRELTVQDRQSIFIPDNCQTVELSVGHSAYSVRLIDTPFTNEEEVEVHKNDQEEDDDQEDEEEDQLGASDFNEITVGQYNVCALDCLATGQKVSTDGSIVLAPRPRTRKILSQVEEPSILLSDGEVLLTDLRGEFLAQGMKAEYTTLTLGAYQQLLVNGRILIRKELKSGKISVEGPLCQDFFFARSVVHSRYTTI